MTTGCEHNVMRALKIQARCANAPYGLFPLPGFGTAAPLPRPESLAGTDLKQPA